MYLGRMKCLFAGLNEELPRHASVYDDRRRIFSASTPRAVFRRRRGYCGGATTMPRFIDARAEQKTLPAGPPAGFTQRR